MWRLVLNEFFKASINANIDLTMFPSETGSEIQRKRANILLSRGPHSTGQAWERKHFRFGYGGTFVVETCSRNDWNVLQKHARGRELQWQRETPPQEGIRRRTVTLSRLLGTEGVSGKLHNHTAWNLRILSYSIDWVQLVVAYENITVRLLACFLLHSL